MSTQNQNASPPIATLLVQRRLDDVRSGSGVYLLGLIDRLLAAGFRVRIVVAPLAGFGSRPASRPSAAFGKRGCEIVWPGTLRIGNVFVSCGVAVWRRSLKLVLERLRWAVGGRRGPRPSVPSSLGRMPRGPELERLLAAVNEVASVIVVAEYSSLAPVLSQCQTGARAVLLHDLFSCRAASFREVGLVPDHEPVSLAVELDWLSTADLLLYASAAEASRITEHLPDKRHIWLPPQVHAGPDAEAIPGPAAARVRKPGRPRAVFLGVRHGGNLDAINLLLGEIWPRVRHAMPAAELWIAGEISDVVADLPEGPPPGVRLIGPVDDTAELGGPDAVGLAPVRAASGVSIKVATYLSLGMSVVACSRALEGYGGELDDLVMKADGVEAFAAATVALLSDAGLRAQKAQSGAAALAARLDHAEFEAYLASLLAEAQPPGPRPGLAILPSPESRALAF
jgi:hypothetical protein